MALSGYGRLYVSGGSTAQTLNASGGTFDKMSGFATDGISSNMTVANATDNITVAQAGGASMPIRVNFSVSFTIGTNGLYRIAVYQDAAVVAGSERRISCVTGTTYTVSGAVITTATDGASPVFDLRLASDQTGPTLTPSYASLEVIQ